ILAAREPWITGVDIPRVVEVGLRQARVGSRRAAVGGRVEVARRYHRPASLRRPGEELLPLLLLNRGIGLGFQVRVHEVELLVVELAVDGTPAAIEGERASRRRQDLLRRVTPTLRV